MKRRAARTYVFPKANDRKAFALLLVIVTLVIAVTSLVSLAQQNLQATTSSLAQVEALQAKWGIHSIEDLALKRANAILTELNLEQQSGSLAPSRPYEPVFQVRGDVQLGEQEFSFLLADENAKLSFSTFRNLEKPAMAAELAFQDAIRTLVAPKFIGTFRTGWQRQLASGNMSIGMLVDMKKLSQSSGSPRSLAELTRSLSLWSTGPLNVTRASSKVLIAQCQFVIPKGQAQSLVKEIERLRGRLDLNLLLEKQISDPRDREAMRALLGTESRSFSVWTEAATEKGMRYQQFKVRTLDDDGNVSLYRMHL